MSGNGKRCSNPGLWVETSRGRGVGGLNRPAVLTPDSAPLSAERCLSVCDVRLGGPRLPQTCRFNQRRRDGSSLRTRTRMSGRFVLQHLRSHEDVSTKDSGTTVFLRLQSVAVAAVSSQTSFLSAFPAVWRLKTTEQTLQEGGVGR